MFPLWANRSRRHYEEKQAAIRQQQEQAMQAQEDFLDGSQRRIAKALTRAQERQMKLEHEITQLQEQLRQTIIVVQALQSADEVLTSATLDQRTVEEMAAALAPENNDE